MSKGSKKKSAPRKLQQQLQQQQQYPQQTYPIPPIPPAVAAHYFSQLALKAKHNKRNGSASLSFGSLDLAALAQSGDLSAATAAVTSQKPCSEQEVKALMSMFAEIMGMEEPTSKSNNKLPVFTRSRNIMSASMTSQLAAAMNNTILAAVDDDDNDDDDDDDDDDEYSDEEQGQKQSATPTIISPEDWNQLEQVVTDEQLAKEDKHIKAMKRREKKHRKKDRVRQEREGKAVATTEKKQAAKLQSWMSTLISAVQANDITKLQSILNERPLVARDDIQKCMESLWSCCMAKSRDQVEQGNEARHALAEYVLSNHLDVALSVKAGRNSLHSSCLIGDSPLLQKIIEKLSLNDPKVLSALLTVTCEDSGWTALHYAVMSTSSECMEILLAAGANTQIQTHPYKTSLHSCGLTPNELAQAIVAGKVSDIVSLGSAMEDMDVVNSSKSQDEHQYLDLLKERMKRLSDIVLKGYSPPSSSSYIQQEQGEGKEELLPSRGDAAKKKRKKKKKQQLLQDDGAAKVIKPIVDQEDPMITALLGMGFTKEQITEAVAALGGINKVTADDVVVWIFGAGESETDPSNITTPHQEAAKSFDEVITEDGQGHLDVQSTKEQVRSAIRAEEERIAAQRLAAKRDDQRRRNREWNNKEQRRQREEAQAKLNRPFELKVKAEPARQVCQQQHFSYIPESSVPTPLGIPSPLIAATSSINQLGLSDRLQNGLLGGIPGIMSGMDAVNLGKINSYMQPQSNEVEMLSSDFPSLSRDGFYDEDAATVSSLGSRRTGSTQGDNFSIQPSFESYLERQSFAPVPPGFNLPIQGNAGIPALPTYGPNHTGEIRATARAFVPTVTLKQERASPPNGVVHIVPSEKSTLINSTHTDSIFTCEPIIGNTGILGMNAVLSPSLLAAAVPIEQESIHSGFFHCRGTVSHSSRQYPPIKSTVGSDTGVFVHGDGPLSADSGTDLDKPVSSNSSLYDLHPITSHGVIGSNLDYIPTTSSGIDLWGSGIVPTPIPAGPTLLGGLLSFGDMDDFHDENGAASLPLNPGWNAGGPQYNSGDTSSNGLGSIW